VLGDEQAGDRGEAREQEDVGQAWLEVPAGGERGERESVHGSADPDRALPAEFGGDRVEAGGLVVLEVLQRVDDVKAGDPEHDERGDAPDRGRGGEVRRVDGDDGGDGAERQRGTEEEVAECGEAFGVAVERDEPEHGDAEVGRPRVAKQGPERGGEDAEDECRAERDEPAVAGGEAAAGDGAAFGARVVGVEFVVGEAVDEHRPCPGGNHARDDERELDGECAKGRGEVGGECCAEDRKRERKDGVGELDVAGGDCEAGFG